MFYANMPTGNKMTISFTFTGLPIEGLALESSVPVGVIAGVGTDIVFTWSWDQGSGMTCDLHDDGSAISGTQWIQVCKSYAEAL